MWNAKGETDTWVISRTFFEERHEDSKGLKKILVQQQMLQRA